MTVNIRGPVRARDLRANIKELGFEQGVVVTMELLLEEHQADRQQMREIAELLFKCIEQVGQMVQVGSGMHERLNALQRAMSAEDDDAKH